MKIKMLSACTTKGFTINTEAFKLFKPDDLAVRLYFSDNSFFEIEIHDETETMSLDEFMHEVGFVMSREHLIQHSVGLEAVHKFLMSDEAKVEYAPKRKFGDNSNEAVLTREVLKVSPHCSPQEFKSIAFDLYKNLGFTKEDLKLAINLYA